MRHETETFETDLNEILVSHCLSLRRFNLAAHRHEDQSGGAWAGLRDAQMSAAGMPMVGWSTNADRAQGCEKMAAHPARVLLCWHSVMRHVGAVRVRWDSQVMYTRPRSRTAPGGWRTAHLLWSTTGACRGGVRDSDHRPPHRTPLSRSRCRVWARWAWKADAETTVCGHPLVPLSRHPLVPLSKASVLLLRQPRRQTLQV